MEGLGSYWECISRDKAEVIAHFVTKVEDYQVMKACEPVPSDLADTYDVAIPMEFDAGSLSFLMWLAGSVPDGKPVAISTYPFIKHGTPYKVKILGIQQWEKNIEGVVIAEYEGLTFGFFDAFFLLNKERYAVGSELTFVLSALGLNIRNLSEIAEVTNGRPDRSAMADIITSVYEGRRVTFPNPDEDTPDVLLTFSRIDEVKSELCDTYSVNVCKVALHASDDKTPLTVPLIFGDDSIDTENWKLKVGDFISARILMQGYLLGGMPVISSDDTP